MAEGHLTPEAVDWHSKLLEAETKLLNEFHRWLRSAELFEIRAAIAYASRRVAAARPSPEPSIDVFLTCTPIELARFPWEAWEIGTDFAVTGTIRIVRTPATIQAESFHTRWHRRGRARILAILGDDTGLNFQTDRDAVRSLARMAEVTFVGWQPGQTAVEVKEHISRAIADERGWDVLFFAGHSNETATTGGELAIAPGVSISIRDITAHLTEAKQRGLQVAIFNSCNGLRIAESLISLGFSQVVVMREPIHNRVAQEFLVQFLCHLADHQDVHGSLLAACQFLRLKKNLTYPSAYLIPSLFCHPGAPLFRIMPFGWKQQLRHLLPTRWEAIALPICVILSVIPAVQQVLLHGRIGVQAVYRDMTGQVPAIATPPPVTVIQIDTESISRDGIAQIHPLDRNYLASLVHRLTALDASVIGIDVVFDTPQPGDVALGKAVQTAVVEQGTWFVFAALLDGTRELGVSAATQITTQGASLQGFIDADPSHVMMPLVDEDCRQTCPFAYLLALTQTARQELPAAALPHPQGQDNRDLNLRTQLLDAIASNIPHNPALTALWRSRLPLMSYWAYEIGRQHWLEPIIDFSIPSDRIYDRIPAWQLLNGAQPTEAGRLSQQIVMIAAGTDERTAIAPGQPDRIPAPPAIRYWQPQQHWLAGSEALAYMVHHLLTQRLLMPIPDLWMVGMATIIGKALAMRLQHQRLQHFWTPRQQIYYGSALATTTALYGLVGLQLYISAEILLPWFLPSVTVWMYVLPTLRRKPYG